MCVSNTMFAMEGGAPARALNGGEPVLSKALVPQCPSTQTAPCEENNKNVVFSLQKKFIGKGLLHFLSLNWSYNKKIYLLHLYPFCSLG